VGAPTSAAGAGERDTGLEERMLERLDLTEKFIGGELPMKLPPDREVAALGLEVANKLRDGGAATRVGRLLRIEAELLPKTGR
jgi:hypothetical protein